MANKKPPIYISKFFTDNDSLWLPSWSIYHVPEELEKSNILKMALKMDEIREILACPITINCWIRPFCVNAPGSEYDGKDYNKTKGGVLHSAHTVGLAVDFTPTKMSCDMAREKIVPYLEKLNIRMERKPLSNWVHVDLFPPKPNRYFIP